MNQSKAIGKPSARNVLKYIDDDAVPIGSRRARPNDLSQSHTSISHSNHPSNMLPPPPIQVLKASRSSSNSRKENHHYIPAQYSSTEMIALTSSQKSIQPRMQSQQEDLPKVTECKVDTVVKRSINAQNNHNESNLAPKPATKRKKYSKAEEILSQSLQQFQSTVSGSSVSSTSSAASASAFSFAALNISSAQLHQGNFRGLNNKDSSTNNLIIPPSTSTGRAYGNLNINHSTHNGSSNLGHGGNPSLGTGTGSNSLKMGTFTTGSAALKSKYSRRRAPVVLPSNSSISSTKNQLHMKGYLNSYNPPSYNPSSLYT